MPLATHDTAARIHTTRYLTVATRHRPILGESLLPRVSHTLPSPKRLPRAGRCCPPPHGSRWLASGEQRRSVPHVAHPHRNDATTHGGGDATTTPPRTRLLMITPEYTPHACDRDAPTTTTTTQPQPPRRQTPTSPERAAETRKHHPALNTTTPRDKTTTPLVTDTLRPARAQKHSGAAAGTTVARPGAPRPGARRGRTARRRRAKGHTPRLLAGAAARPHPGPPREGTGLSPFNTYTQQTHTLTHARREPPPPVC